MKFMNMKRFGSIVMVGAMALSLAAPAFAAGDTTEITATYTPPVISVSVPETGTAQINPYGMPVSFTKSDSISKVSIVGQKITSAPLSIKNQGDTKLAVNASFKALPKSGSALSIKGAALDPTAASNPDKGKQVDLSLEVVGLSDTKYAVSSVTPSLEDDLLTAFATESTWDNAKSLRAPAAASSSATVNANKSANAMAALGAATVGAGNLVTYGKDSIALFRLTGDLNADPVDTANSNADLPWTTDDGFTATVVFKFTPYKEASLTLTATSTSLTTSAPNNAGAVTASFVAGDTGLTVTKYDWTSGTPATATVTAGGNASATTTSVTAQAAGTTEIKCVATLSDGTTKEATVNITVA